VALLEGILRGQFPPFRQDRGLRCATRARRKNQGAIQGLNSPTDKNLVIFDCEGRVKIVPGDSLTQVKLEAVPNPKEREFRRRADCLPW